MFQRPSRTIYRVLTASVSLLVVLLSFHYALFNFWQEQLTDRFFIKENPPKNIVIVAIDETSFTTFGQWPWERSVFAQTIEALQRAKAIGIDINFSEPSRVGTYDDEILARALEASTPPVILPVELSPQGSVLTRPLPIFEAPSTQGFVNVSADMDGVLRKTETSLRTLHEKIPEIFSFAQALSPEPKSKSTFRVWYTGPQDTFLTVSLTDVLSGTVPQEVFTDSYVLVGATAPNLHDFIQTPFGSMPGVEVHANILSNILSQKYLKEPSTFWSLFLLAGIVILSGLSVVYIRSFGLLILVLCAFVTALLIGSITLFFRGIVAPLFYELLALLVGSSAMLVLEYITESKEKQFIRKTFHHYLPEEVVTELMKHPEKLSLGGERKEITIFFSDIRGFTTVSESLSPEELTRLMNEYLTAMTDIIMKHHGIVDKYIGDAIMAFWGAPLTNVRQVEDACAASLEMLEKLQELNIEWGKRGIASITVGMGINTGEVVVGNMGSSKRFNYTVMGDEVNFTSRLEGLTKMYHTTILVSENTMQKLSSKDSELYTFRELDTVVVKGKKEPRVIYELARKTPEIQKVYSEFQTARSIYQAGDFKKAQQLFERLVADTKDGPSKTFVERSRNYAENPPGNWDGIYHSTEK
jgi:adenylate cyclase